MTKRKLDDSQKETTSEPAKKPTVQSFLFPTMSQEEKKKYDENLEKLRLNLQSSGLSPPNLVRNS